LVTGDDNHGIGAPVFVDVQVPGVGNDFRDYAQILADEPEGILDPTGAKPTFPTTHLPDATFFFNYRTEPLRNRLRAVLQHQAGKKVTLPNGTVILADDHFCDGFTNDQSEATAGFFVAFTRAKQRVVFSYCASRGGRTKIAALYQLLTKAGVKTVKVA